MTKELRATGVCRWIFVSNISHEFKTRLVPFEGYTMLLQGELSQEQEEYEKNPVLIPKAFRDWLEIF